MYKNTYILYKKIVQTWRYFKYIFIFIYGLDMLPL